MALMQADRSCFDGIWNRCKHISYVKLEYIHRKLSAFDQQQLRWQLLSLAIMWHKDICTSVELCS